MPFILGLILSFFVLTACENSPVEMFESSENELTSVSFSLDTTYWDVTPAGANELVALSSVHYPKLVRNSYYPDADVYELQIYTSSNCMANYLGSISNQEGAPNYFVSQSFLSDGSYPLFYKPSSNNFGSQLTSLCIPARITYIVDSSTSFVTLSAVTPLSSHLTTRSVSVSNCSRYAVTDASAVFVSEANYASPETEIAATQWTSCEASGSTNLSVPVTHLPVSSTRSLWIYAKDKVGHISKQSASFEMLTPIVPILGNTSPAYYFAKGSTAVISIPNSGASIQNCSYQVTTAPGWVQTSAFTNECRLVIETSIARPEVELHLVALSTSGENSEPVTFKVSVVEVDVHFGTTGTDPDNRPWVTKMEADVLGDHFAEYQYKLGQGVNCTLGSGYSTWRPRGVKLIEDLHNGVLNGPRFEDGVDLTLCVVGRTSTGSDQSYASPYIKTWKKNPQIQLFDSIPNGTYFRESGLDLAESYYSRVFRVGANTTAIKCHSCYARKAPTLAALGSATFYQDSSILVSSGDYIQFKMISSLTLGEDVSYLIRRTDSDSSDYAYNFSLKNMSGSCGNQNTVFLTKGKYEGGLGGVLEADAICQREATAVGHSQAANFKALIHRTSGVPVLNVLELSKDYCGYPNMGKVIAYRTFTNALTQFVDGSLTNGGENAWSTIADTFRENNEGTKVWVGDSTYNCNMWTDSTGTGKTGTLRHQADYDGAQNWAGDLGSPAHINSCKEKRHILCYFTQ